MRGDIYLRCYSANKKVRILDVPDDHAAASLDFPSWAREHLRHRSPALIEELALAFVRYYKAQWQVPMHDQRLVAQFNIAVDTLKKLHEVAAAASAAGDSFGTYIGELTSQLVEPPVRGRKIQSRVHGNTVLPLGAFAKRREKSPKMGAPWLPARRCGRALAQAWRHTFRALPESTADFNAYYELLCSILPEEHIPDRSPVLRALKDDRKSLQLEVTPRTPWG